jgi:hypothetical protein
MESIEKNGQTPRVTMEEWREIASSNERFADWLASHPQIEIITTTSEDGREGNFAEIIIDSERQWVATDDMGTIVEPASKTFWNLP